MSSMDNFSRIPKVTLSACTREILSHQTPSYSVMLVNGTPMDRLRTLGAIERLRRARWDILALRLGEEIINKESEFSALLMRNLAQEVDRMENLSEDLKSRVSEYLQPFEFSERSTRRGITFNLFMEQENKFVRKTKSHDDLRRDYTVCFDLMQELEWRPVLILESIEELSNLCKSFLLYFLDRYGLRSITILGGSTQEGLESFVRDQGITRHFRAAFVTCDVEDDKGNRANTKPVAEIRRDAVDLAACIVDAFAIASRKFNYLKLDVWQQLGSDDLEGGNLDFDLCLLGHLRMREDYPRLIRTDYDCAILVKVLDDPLTQLEPVKRVVESAHRMLIHGSSYGKSCSFDPWDTFVFLAAPGISMTVLDGYQHLPYRNLFVVLSDGTFHNLSPHEWMGNVLNSISLRWSAGSSLKPCGD